MRNVMIILVVVFAKALLFVWWRFFHRARPAQPPRSISDDPRMRGVMAQSLC
jgi:hypothetical protein